jgi:hypothetical protein
MQSRPSGRRLFRFMAVAAIYGRASGTSRPSPSTPSDCVYVIGGEHGHVKIGSSGDPHQRCRDLQTGSPFRLWVEHVAPTCGAALPVELRAHALLQKHRLSGEWFAVPAEAAVAAIHAAAYQIGVSVAGLNSVPAEVVDWRRRFLVTAALASPFWVLLGLGHPSLAVGYLFLSMVGAVIGLVRQSADPEPARRNTLRWIGIVLAGCLLPVIPAIAVSSGVDRGNVAMTRTSTHER